MRVTQLLGLLPCLAALAAGPAVGATVTVSFIEPGHYADAGTSAWDREANQQVLARYLQALGLRGLPADEALQVEVLDVDLAGTVWPSRRGAAPVRIVRGSADAPHIRLRYTLDVPGQPTRSGEESLGDLGYLRELPVAAASDPLSHEKRLLQAWFKARFVERHAAVD